MASLRASADRRHSFSTSTPPLLGYFHHPVPTPPRGRPHETLPTPPSGPAPTFEPLTAASPRLSLDFLPGFSDLYLYDSHLGLLLLRDREQPTGRHFRCFIVCDPVSRRHTVFHPPPINPIAGGEFFGCAILSRDCAGDTDGGLCFDVVCLALDVDRPRAWVASFHDGVCHWRLLPRSREVTVTFDPYWFEHICVHAAGSLYWHVCNYDSALALDPATMEFSFLRAPVLMWDHAERNFHKFRFGEMPEGGQLCVASMEEDVLQLCVRSKGAGSDQYGWVLARHVDVGEELDEAGLPKHGLVRAWVCCLNDIDAGRTGKVFIRTFGFGRFSYHIDTGKLERLMTEDGQEYGKNIFAYFASPDGSSD